MSFSKRVTVIQLSVETRDKLKALGSKGDTYEDIILCLIKNQKK